MTKAGSCLVHVELHGGEEEQHVCVGNEYWRA